MRRLPSLSRAAALIAVLSACATNSGGVISGGGDAGRDDAPASDGGVRVDGAAGSDGGGTDVPATGSDGTVTSDAPVGMDVVTEMDAPAVPVDGAVSPDAAGGADVVIPADRVGGCSRDEQCAANELGLNRCDPASGRCVQCLPSMDTCPTDQFCDPRTLACARGCRDDSSCRTMSGADGGASGQRCNPVTRACVDCLMDSDCGSGNLCVGNVCVPGCAGGRGCGPGESCCSGACINTAANIANCGACGNVCRVANGQPTCAMGRCEVGSCTGSARDCDMNAANGCETDTQSNINHCGGCGRVCPSPPHASGTCTAGSCGFVCDEGYADCNGVPEDGCEADLNANRRTAADA